MCMKKGQYSRTAEAAAALRANHSLFSKEPIFNDAYAYAMTSKLWQLLLKQPLMSKLFNSQLVNRTMGRLTAQVVGRSRYAEDQLKQAINKGINQYVLVGAGLDSFVLRQLHYYPKLRIFEVDHPDTQYHKKQKLEQLGDISDQIEFVSIDFEKESIADALTRSCFDSNQAAFFAWLGTTHYLENHTTLATLDSIAQIAASGSEVVLDYSIDFNELKGIEKIGTQFVAIFTQVLGEPLQGQFKPLDLHHQVEKIGFRVLEDLSGEALTQRYFHMRADQMKHTTATHMLHLKLNGLT